nr:PREDICTED: uncharacterized protein LOC108219369 [Daucus carota subsp. sativus]
MGGTQTGVPDNMEVDKNAEGMSIGFTCNMNRIEEFLEGYFDNLEIQVQPLVRARLNRSWNVNFHEGYFPFHDPDSLQKIDTAIYLPVSASTVSYDDSINPSAVSTSTHNSGASSPESHTTSQNSTQNFTQHSPPTTQPNTSDTRMTNSQHTTPPSVHLSTTSIVDLSSHTEFPELRRSSRAHKAPTYLSNYQCHAFVSSHWCNLVQHQPTVTPCAVTEPTSYVEAATDPLWISAMQAEISALNKNHTWDLVTLPKGKKTIGSKWVFKVKVKADGSLERCKARLVAKGFNQKYGIDIVETFSPVVKMGTVRILLALAASKNWSVFQLDVNNAFFHGTLVEEVYMKVPEGIPNPDNLVCLLRKSIYGLRQASRCWNYKLVAELFRQGFSQSKNDYSLFTKHCNGKICIVSVYVDDVLLIGTDLDVI